MQCEISPASAKPHTWEEKLRGSDIPTSLAAPNTPQNEQGFLLAELLQASQERQRRMASLQRLPINIPDDAAQVVPTAGTTDNVGRAGLHHQMVHKCVTMVLADESDEEVLQGAFRRSIGAPSRTSGQMSDGAMVGTCR